MRELCGVKVLYEPHQSAYYQDPEDGFRHDRVPYTPSLYDSADEKLLANYDGCSALFAKNMGYFIPKERYETYVEGRFATFKHTFLIRTPFKSSPSCEESVQQVQLSNFQRLQILTSNSMSCLNSCRAEVKLRQSSMQTTFKKTLRESCNITVQPQACLTTRRC